MTSELVMQLARNAVYLILLLSAPLLLAGLVVGLIVSILQATTQVQEQTLAFIPKIIATFVALLFFGPWMLAQAMDFTREILRQMVFWIG